MNQHIRVRILNFFRKIFKVQFLESFLARQTFGKSPKHFVSRFVPNPYQYKQGSFRLLRTHGVVMRVDISDYLGHFYFYGFTDVAMTTLFALCKKNSIVLDVGANIGWTTLIFARIASQGKVLGFEPDPYNFERCSENISLNDFKNLEVFQLGLGSTNSEKHLEIVTESNLAGNRIVPHETDSSSRVKIVKLDDFHPVKGLAKIDLIKLDVEGYELKVLKGAEEVLKKYTPVLFIELDDNNLKEQQDSATLLIDYLFAIGYKEIENVENKSRLSTGSDFSNCHFDIIARYV